MPTSTPLRRVSSISILAISPPSLIDVNRAIYRELACQGRSIEIVVPSETGYAHGPRTPDALQADDPPIHRLRPTSESQRLRTFRRLIALLESRRPRIIYIDGDPASFLTVQIGIWARYRGAAVVCQSCDNLSRTFKSSFKRSGFRGLLASLVIQFFAAAAKPNLAHIFSINQDGLQVFSELGFRGNVSCIPLGFDPALFYRNPELRERARRELGLQHITIAFFGMLRWAKGVHLLIEALEGLLAHDWQLLVDRFEIYRDPYTEQINKMLERSPVGKRVVFFDATHRQMPQYINAADIVVLPSISTPTIKEQYGRAISEAMACGRMVIVSQSGALPELVGGAGLEIPENDVPALRQALLRALDDPNLREQLGNKALQRAHSSLSVKQQAVIMGEKFDQILRRLGGADLPG